jgi:hypothetical protein
MYRLRQNTNKIQECIERISDGVWIPSDTNNTDYQEYLRWLEEGNVPEIIDESVGDQ